MKLPLLPHALDGFPLPLQIHSPPFSVPRKSNRQGSHQRAPLHSGFPLNSAIREHWSESGCWQGSYLIPHLLLAGRAQVMCPAGQPSPPLLEAPGPSVWGS